MASDAVVLAIGLGYCCQHFYVDCYLLRSHAESRVKDRSTTTALKTIQQKWKFFMNVHSVKKTLIYMQTVLCTSTGRYGARGLRDFQVVLVRKPDQGPKASKDANFRNYDFKVLPLERGA
jgi:hypothetical protein